MGRYIIATGLEDRTTTGKQQHAHNQEHVRTEGVLMLTLDSFRDGKADAEDVVEAIKAVIDTERYHN